MKIITAFLVGILATISGLLHPAPPFTFSPPHKFGGLSTWTGSRGEILYDTPSGNLDIGDYEILAGAVLFAHYSTTTTATTTRPAGYYVPPNALGLTLAHRIGIRYIDTFADGASYYGSSTIDSKLNQPNAPIPDEAVDQAAGPAI